MPALHLIEALPPPPEGSIGWPWTKAPAAGTHVTLECSAWPKISIVTPSYNHGPFLEETIRSVLLQEYPNLEYHIMDGGSTDESVAIIRKYERWLTSWVSERDRGQSEAINKGFARSSGEIFNWLCSDDLLEPGALSRVARTFMGAPRYDVVVGDCFCRYEQDAARSCVCRSDVARLERSPFLAAIWQPSCFFKRHLIRRPSLVREELNFCMDRELWCYLHQQGARWKHVPHSLSVNRFTGANKSVTGREKIIAEIDTLYRGFVREKVPLTYWLSRVWLPLVKIQKHHPSATLRVGSRLLSSSVSLLLRLLYPVDRLKLLRAEYYGYAMW